jgi:L,D-peptidoglycan transpeptidase YkuD (ErfK/YbiS/YcfS/YnhG family)
VRTVRQRRTAAILLIAAALTAACSSGSPAPVRSGIPDIAQRPGVTASSSSTVVSTPAPTPATRRHSAPRQRPAAVRAPSSTASAAQARTAAPHAGSLPLPFSTRGAGQVITVTASGPASTEGTLQAWRQVPGGWRRVGPAVPAWLGSDGLTRHPSETRSATPIGSFTLTRAFGHDADPGTALPYTRTTPDDWWISEAGPLYNTRQRCASNCAFRLGDPNEHLYYETPYYNYAIVIDYNTRNAPGGVVQGAGSAFFLHVTVGAPTAGCVSIDQSQLIRILRWLSPARHPRILIGTV